MTSAFEASSFRIIKTASPVCLFDYHEAAFSVYAFQRFDRVCSSAAPFGAGDAAIVGDESDGDGVNTHVLYLQLAVERRAFHRSTFCDIVNIVFVWIELLFFAISHFFSFQLILFYSS